uniref:FACT complex subunit n=1 Tax=Trypanosoma congolense (strain IL3000) TaxID=1068625 RepID=G0UKL6_TRYCI|nr:conserved hypothetical protein [Trypanosoma congolense IL3000]
MSSIILSEARLQGILSAWGAFPSTTASCTVVCCVFGKLTPDTLENQRGQAMLQYLFTSPKAISDVALFFSPSKLLVVHEGHTIELPPSTEDYTYCVASLDDKCSETLLSFLGDAMVGVCQKELGLQEGDFATKLITIIREIVPAERTVEVAPLLGELLFVKDEAALLCIEKAAGLCNAIFRRFVRKMIADEMQKSNPEALSTLREELTKKLEMPNTVVGLETLDISQFSIASGLTPCIMHRGTYNSQINVTEVSTQPLKSDIIVIRYGTKNCGHTAFIARTLIVEKNAPPNAKDAYTFAYDISDKVMKLLQVGSRLSDIYEEVMTYANTTNAELAGLLPKSLGFSTGLLVLEPRGTISARGTATVANGMAFVIRIVLEGVPDGSGGGTFDLELSDTVTVKNDTALLNTKAPRKLEDITYDEEENEEGAFENSKRDLSKITRQGQSNVPLLSREAVREEKLKTLLRELHAEMVASGGKKTTTSASEELRIHEIARVSNGEVIPYKDESMFPQEARAGGIHVDMAKEVVFFPVCGSLAAFHASTINKIDIKQEGDHVVAVFTLHSLQEGNIAYRLNRTKIFVKELTYRAGRDIFTDIKIAIQGIHQRIKNRDADRRQRSSSSASARLVLNPNAIRLPQVKIRPPATTGRYNKECVGNVELHGNGLRFSYIGGTPIDILFENVKHFIFQPAVNAVRVVYHVTLKKSVEISRKSVDEVQFIADVMESSENVMAGRKSYEEEIAAEERELMRVSDTNKQFMRFAQSVEKVSNIKTQIPVSNFSFEGVHAKGLTTFKANREVLWSIIDRPPFTQRVEDIEVVSLERVIPGGSTFDVTLIFKDYHKQPASITTVPRSSLESIKDWCLAARLYYMETSVNPNWKVLLKTLSEDEEWEPWNPSAGWAVLNDDIEGGEDGSDDSDSDDTTYEEEETDSDETGSSFLDDEESESETGDDEGDSESVVSWDELERRAEAHDRKRGYDSDGSSGRPRKKARTAAPSRQPPQQPPTAGRAVRRFPPMGTAVPPPRRF